METEKARHETEESLTLKQLSATHQVDPVHVKLQNGSQSPEMSPKQLNGDTSWSHCKPNAGVNPMKRHRDKCSSPGIMQGIFDQGSYGMNGEMKHALSQQSLLSLHHSKKLCTNSEVNQDKELSVWGMKETDTEGHLDRNPELNKPELDKRNCNYPNGDIFSLSGNKQVLTSNGATVTPPSVEGPAGDLLEKTLSQYYPEHVSIAPQTSSIQADRVTSNLREQVIPSPSLTSGYPNSASEPLAKTPQEVHSSNGYETVLMLNGYSSSFGAEQQQKPPPYPLADVPALEVHSQSEMGKGPGMAPQTSITDCSQTQNSTECFPSNPEGLNVFSKSNQDFSQESYPLPPPQAGTPTQAEGAGTFSLFGSQAGDQVPSPLAGQQHLQYGMQQHQSDISCSADGSPQDPRVSALSTVPNPPPAQQSVEPQTEGSRLDSQASPATLQNQCSELENKLSLPRQAEQMSEKTAPGQEMGWIDLNSARGPQRPASQPQMWKDFPPDESKAPQNQGSLLDPDPSNNFQAQGFSQPTFPPQQDFQMQNGYKHATPPTQPQHNAAPEWQPGNSNTPGIQAQLSMHLSKFQHLSQQCNVAQQQVNQQFCPQIQDQLCKNNEDLQQILSPGFLLQHPQTHQQYKTHQQQVRTLHCQEAQAQDLSQGQVDSQVKSRQKLECYINSEVSSPTQRSPKPPGHVQTRSNPSMRANFTFSHPSQPNLQSLPNDKASMFSFSDSAEPQKQQQRHYTPGSNTQKQYTQQPLNHRLPSHLNFQQLPRSQPQPQIPDGAHGPQMLAQMFPKAESQESCAQFQGQPLQSPGAQADFQKHAALQMHPLHKQERQNRPQSPNHIRPEFQYIKRENVPRFEAPVQMPTPYMQQQDRNLVSTILGTVKQERPSSSCEENQHRSILATMEQQLQQYELSPVFEKKSLVIKSPSKVKVEMSGGVTVVSTNLEGSEEQRKLPDSTSKKMEPGLQSFLDSPRKLLDTPIKNLLDTPLKTQYDIAPCHCVEQISEKDEGPYYTHLGAAPNIQGIRDIMEKRTGLSGSAIRIEKVVYTGKEGKSTQGCPIAKWVIRRASVDEKLLVLVRERPDHSCETSCIVVVILIWEGIPTSLADHLYVELSDTLTKHGALTNRRCALNEERTCACQGLNPEACGASFSFGCSWSMYYNGCKFARSKVPRKFKLLGDDPKEEEKLERNLQGLATLIAPAYKKLAPDAYGNQVEHEHRAPDCRLGLKEGRPFSGVTACLDFCAHAHRDLHNMPGGSTVVCTLTREDNREIGKIPEDEQLHVLPLYKAASTDEFGSTEAQLEKTKTGAIQVLSVFRRQVRMLAEPAKSCRQKKLDAKKAAANKPSQANMHNSKMDSTQQVKQQKQSPYDNMGQTTPASGADSGHRGVPFQSGQHLLAAQNQPQQQQPQTPLPFSSSPTPANYPRFPNAPGSFPSTSKPAKIFPQPPGSASPYHSPLTVPSSYMNGSNAPSTYPGSLTPNNLYPGYQCNGGMPMDNYHPYYSNPKHLDMYKQQRPLMYPDQQFGPHQRYGVEYPPRYGEPSLPVNGYGNCNMRPSMHHMGHYPGYSPNMGPDPQFLDAISRPPSAHSSLDYAAANKCSQFGRYPNPYLAQNPQMFPPNLDPLSMQNKPDMNLHRANGIPQVLPTLSSDCLNPSQPAGMGLPNGNLPPPMVKQEPGILMPAPKEDEDVWSDNEHNFLDPDIGGVAVAPSHGSILIECAKRELHATTPLKKPDRNHPTRISLVFYQHKNMNEAKHGLALWEAKMAEKAREKEEDAEKHGADSTPSKSGGKKVKREHPEPSETSEPPYKRFIQMLTEKSMSNTTNTYVSSAPYAFTKVTGPYNCFL